MNHVAEEHPPDAVSMTLAREAIAFAAGGDAGSAAARLERARSSARSRARRERQVVEIAAALVAGETTRAEGLAAEHCHEFPGDAGLLDELRRARSAADGHW